MIDALSALIEKHWSAYGLTEAYERDRISLTKFCQRVVGRHTKVLFFVTYKSAPLCILKTVRFSEFNQNLLREAKHQSLAPKTDVLSAPKVYWVDEVDGRVVYAEEYIDALPVSRSDYRALMPHIGAFSSALPQSGSMRAHEFAARITPYLPDDPVVLRHLKTLTESTASLTLGLAHGDIGRQNILGTRDRAWVIDWERAGDVPVHGFDAVDIVLKRNKHAVVSDPVLFAVRNIYVALYKRFPTHYTRLAEVGRSMVA